MSRRVYFGVVGYENRRVPYGAVGKVLRRGPKRTRVDFGKHGIFVCPNPWLKETKPDPDMEKIGREAIQIASQILADRR